MNSSRDLTLLLCILLVAFGSCTTNPRNDEFSDGEYSNDFHFLQSGLLKTFQELETLATSGGGNSGGPVLHSRYAASDGGYERELVTGGDDQVHSYASAGGPNGGVSFSSAFVDENGKAHYKTSARQF